MEKNRPVSKRLFVGSIPFRFTEGELLSLFVPFGKDTELPEVKDELIAMLKTARAALGIERKPSGYNE